MGHYNDTPIKQLSKEPGIAGLKTVVQVPFIRALQAEERGDYVEAERKLAEAVEKESQG